jgi:hypothetical protein
VTSTNNLIPHMRENEWDVLIFTKSCRIDEMKFISQILWLETGWNRSCGSAVWSTRFFPASTRGQLPVYNPIFSTAALPIGDGFVSSIATDTRGAATGSNEHRRSTGSVTFCNKRTCVTAMVHTLTVHVGQHETYLIISNLYTFF